MTRRGQIEVPVGLEQALFLAAREADLKQRLLADPLSAIDEVGIHLRPSERAMLASTMPAALEAMIDRMRPENPKGRRFMRLVAAAATSLAAGTVMLSCDDENSPRYGVDAGVTSDIDVDTDTDADSDSDSDSDDGGPDAGDDGGMDAGDDAGEEWTPDSGMDGGE